MVASGLDRAEAVVATAESANSHVLEEIIATPASSLFGMRIKAEISQSESHCIPELIESLVADLLRMNA